MAELVNGSSHYQVGKLVSEEKSGEYRIYLCMQEPTKRQCLLQIASTTDRNGNLDRQAYILRELKNRSDELEEEYAKASGDSKVRMNYDLCFPEVLDSFVCPEQGNRRVNILALRGVEAVGKAVPMRNLTVKDRLRVDLRTSVWIMGKLLKLLAFVHSEGFAVGLMTGNNLLIVPEGRYTIVFDWSRSLMFDPGETPAEKRKQDIAQAAQAVITVLGGDPRTGSIPDDGEEVTPLYADCLRGLASGNTDDALAAHDAFYALVDRLIPRAFHPFTTRPLPTRS